jgi:hypothetical protein
LFQENRLAIPQLVLGMIAILYMLVLRFLPASNLPAYMEQHLDFNSRCSPHIFALGEFNDWSLDRAVEAFTNDMSLKSTAFLGSLIWLLVCS